MGKATAAEDFLLEAGFKYGLKSQEINAVMAYIKTLK